MSEVRLELCCRLCLKDSFSLVNIFSHRSPSGELVYRILDFVYDITVSQDDGLPSQICVPCLWRLTEFEEYKKNVHHAEAEIMKLISRVKLDSNGIEVNEENNQLERESEELYSNVADDVRESNFIWIKNEIQSEDTEVPIKEEIDISEYEIPEETAVRENMMESTSEIEMNSSQCLESTVEADVDFCEKERNSLDVSPAEPVDDRANIRTRGRKKNYVCDICGKSFSAKRNMSRHSLCHTNVRPYPCTICGQHFKALNERRTHELRHIRDELKNRVKVKGEIENPNSSKCSVNLLNSKLSNLPRNYSCVLCGKQYRSTSGLKQHEKKHSDVKPFSCPTCGKSFYQKYELNEHMYAHSNEKPFPCSVCNKKFKSKKHMKNHELLHLG